LGIFSKKETSKNIIIKYGVREDLTSYKEATCNCSNAYQKNMRSFEVLGKLNPTVLESLAAFRRTRHILNERLQ